MLPIVQALKAEVAPLEAAIRLARGTRAAGGFDMAVRSMRSLSQSVAGAGLIALAIGAVGCTSGAAQRQIETVSGALACARAALGGSQALSAVSSLAVTFEITPDPANKTGRPSTHELTLGLPDKFKTTDRLQLPNRNDFVLMRGFSGDRQLVGGDNQTRIQEPNEESFRVLRSDFARWALMLLLRETPVRPLTWSRDLTSDDAHFRIAATGPDGFNMALLLDKATCQPVAAMWDRAPNFDDAMSGRTPTNGRHVERYDLLEYRTFDGIRLPTRIRTATDGMPRAEWKVTSAQVNPPLPDDLADAPRPTARGSNAGR
jgi:hypothetical protein